MLAYIHIPFCHRICPYCSFYKHTPADTSISSFLDVVLLEAESLDYKKPRTLYLGGGTPSMLSPTHLTRLMTGLQNVLDFSALEEITLEANPATYDVEKAKLFRSLGVNRVSLGIQSFSPHTLKTLGREHDREQAMRAVEILHQVEMPIINIDLMFSIPGLSTEDWQDTLETATALKPHHISAYNLTYEEDTAFFESLKRGDMKQYDDVNASQFFQADEFLIKNGFLHYETSNYAQAGFESIHNSAYWRGEDYVGLGPSAVSTISRTRSKNVADTAAYVKMIRSNKNAIVESEPLPDEAWRLERIALGLRTRHGISLDFLDEEGKSRAAVLAEHALISIVENSIIVTRQGSALVDSIAAEIC